MRAYILTHLTDAGLLRDLAALVAQERTTTAALLAHIAEVDARRLYLPAGHPSMHAYCVGELRLSEDAAYKRIQAARTARQFPAVFEAVADGRLSLTAVVRLRPYLAHENVDEFLQAAARKTNSEIEELLAQRFPRSEMLALVHAIPAPLSLPDTQLVSKPVAPSAAERAGSLAHQLVSRPVDVVLPRTKLRPVAPERFLLQLTVGRSTHDKLRYAQDLLSHQIPSGDVAAVLDRALDALIDGLERRKFAATTRPRANRQRTTGPRHIPAHVKRAVWDRDRGQCTFVSEQGQRCPSRKFLEYDHIDPVARGGQATVEGVRLRCRGHNQYEAEKVFGTGFMSEKREAGRGSTCGRGIARSARGGGVAHAAAEAEARARVAEDVTRSRALAQEHARDVTACLRELGFRADEARREVEFCEAIPDVTLEERVRAALKFLRPKIRSQTTTAHREPARIDAGAGASQVSR